MADRVSESLTAVLEPYGFGLPHTNSRELDEFSVMFSAPYDGDARRFPLTPYEDGELESDAVADLYVLGSASDGIATVEFEGEPLAELLRDLGHNDVARRLEFSLHGPFEEALATVSNSLSAFFATAPTR